MASSPSPSTAKMEVEYDPDLYASNPSAMERMVAYNKGPVRKAVAFSVEQVENRREGDDDPLAPFYSPVKYKNLEEDDEGEEENDAQDLALLEYIMDSRGIHKTPTRFKVAARKDSIEDGSSVGGSDAATLLQQQQQQQQQHSTATDASLTAADSGLGPKTPEKTAHRRLNKKTEAKFRLLRDRLPNYKIDRKMREDIMATCKVMDCWSDEEDGAEEEEGEEDNERLSLGGTSSAPASDAEQSTEHDIDGYESSWVSGSGTESDREHQYAPSKPSTPSSRGGGSSRRKSRTASSGSSRKSDTTAHLATSNSKSNGVIPHTPVIKATTSAQVSKARSKVKMQRPKGMREPSPEHADRVAQAAKIALESREMVRENVVRMAVDIFVELKREKEKEYQSTVKAQMNAHANMKQIAIQRLSVGTVSIAIKKARKSASVRLVKERLKADEVKRREQRAYNVLRKFYRKYKVRKLLKVLIAHVMDMTNMRASVRAEDERLFAERVGKRLNKEAKEFDDFKERKKVVAAAAAVVATAAAAHGDPLLNSGSPRSKYPLSASGHLLERIEATRIEDKQKLRLQQQAQQQKKGNNNNNNNNAKSKARRTPRTPAPPLVEPPSTATHFRAHQQRLLVDKEYARERPDLAPFSTMINKLISDNSVEQAGSGHNSAQETEKSSATYAYTAFQRGGRYRGGSSSANNSPRGGGGGGLLGRGLSSEGVSSSSSSSSRPRLGSAGSESGHYSNSSRMISRVGSPDRHRSSAAGDRRPVPPEALNKFLSPTQQLALRQQQQQFSPTLRRSGAGAPFGAGPVHSPSQSPLASLRKGLSFNREAISAGTAGGSSSSSRGGIDNDGLTADQDQRQEDPYSNSSFPSLLIHPPPSFFSSSYPSPSSSSRKGWELGCYIDDREIESARMNKSAAFKAMEALSGLNEKDILQTKLSTDNAATTNKFKQFGSSILSL